MKPVRNLFLLSAFTKLPLTNRGALSAVREWGQRRGFSVASSQTSRGVGITIQTAPSPENAAKSSVRGAAGKATCTFSGPGLCTEQAGATLLAGQHQPLHCTGPCLCKGTCWPSPGSCVSWPGVKCWRLGKSMHGVAGESGAQVYPKRSHTNLPQPTTRAFHGLSSKACMPQGTQRAR